MKKKLVLFICMMIALTTVVFAAQWPKQIPFLGYNFTYQGIDSEGGFVRYHASEDKDISISYKDWEEPTDYAQEIKDRERELNKDTSFFSHVQLHSCASDAYVLQYAYSYGPYTSVVLEKYSPKGRLAFSVRNSKMINKLPEYSQKLCEFDVLN